MDVVIDACRVCCCLQVLDPVFHAVNMCCYVCVAVIYFVVPALRDLVGNMVSTMAACLAVSQAADLVRIYTELGSHVSFMAADVACYAATLAAFFWLNALGWYVWRTLRSTNVYLRVSDARRYCRYGWYAWGCTAVMCAVAVAAHYTLEAGAARRASALLHRQEVKAQPYDHKHHNYILINRYLRFALGLF